MISWKHVFILLIPSLHSFHFSSYISSLYSINSLINPLECFFRIKGYIALDRNQQPGYNKKTTRVPVLSYQTTRVKTYHLSAKREGDEFFTKGGLVNENSNEGGFLLTMNLKM